MIANLQALRAFAAILVVVFHVAEVAAIYGFSPEYMAKVHQFGASGVDLFFVLSGFLMVHVQNRSPKSGYEFLVNRALRIVPLYWLITTILVAALLLLPSLFRESKFDVSLAVSSLLMVSSALGYPFPVLKPGWSLEFEMLFYLLFALGLVFCKRRVGWFVGGVLLVSVLACGMRPMVLEFLFGMTAAWLSRKTLVQSHAKLVLVVGLLSYLIGISAPQDALQRVYAWGAPGFLIVLGLAVAKQITNDFWINLGNASYSIYLTHVMSMPVFFKLYKMSGMTPLNGDFIVLLGTACCVTIGAGVYKYIEVPLNRVCRAAWLRSAGRTDSPGSGSSRAKS